MKRVIIDTDPGIDDAHALLMALLSPDIQVEGITTVYGNTDIAYCTRNALHLLELVGKTSIPVYQGRTAPLFGEALSTEIGKLVHGKQGLGNLVIAEPKTKPAKENAIQWLIETVLKSPGEIEVLALGPLTNIALAHLAEPKWAEAVKRVIFMGGIISGPGNVAPLSTANITNDAEAAKIVFHSGVKEIVMVGQDVTRDAFLSPAHHAVLREADTPVTRFLDQITDFYQNFYVSRDPSLEKKGVPIHDMLVVAYLLRPDLFETEKLYVTVETQGQVTRGQTVPDWRPFSKNKPQMDVCMKVDKQKLFDLYLNTICNAIQY